MSSYFKNGSMVKFDIINKHFTDDGFSTGGTIPKSDNEMFIYEKIDLENFPSFNDFKGGRSRVKHDDVTLILGRVGRPFKINRKQKWDIYDIYEVMIDNQKRCVFKFNLKKL